MTNLFSGLDRAENNPFIYGAFGLSNESSSDGWLDSWTPLAVDGGIPDQTPSTSYSSTDLSDMTAMRRELDMVKGELRATQSRLRDLLYGTDARLSFFEQKYQHDQTQKNRIRHAQEVQLERRLQHHIKKSVVEAMQQAMERFIRLRRSVGPEPSTRQSTYKIPNRPEGTGIFR